MVKVGLIDGHATRISGAQASGCAPVATAFKSGTDHIRPVKPSTIAKSLAIGNPADGYYAVKVARDTGGAIEDVSDAEVVDGIQLLARTEGIFAETAGGVVIATLRKLCDAGVVRPDERVVALITGDGLKTIEAVTERATPTMVIPPRLDDFRGQLDLISSGAEA
jgi:threonine synthase